MMEWWNDGIEEKTLYSILPKFHYSLMLLASVYINYSHFDSKP